LSKEQKPSGLGTSPRELLRLYYRIVLTTGAAVLGLHAVIGFVGGFGNLFAPYVLGIDAFLLLLGFLGFEMTGPADIPGTPRKKPKGTFLIFLGLYLVLVSSETGGLASPFAMLIVLNCVFAAMVMPGRSAVLLTSVIAAVYVFAIWMRPEDGFLLGGVPGIEAMLSKGRAMSREQFTGLALHCGFLFAGMFIALRLAHSFQAQVSSLTDHATRDPLTQLPNRRGFTEKMRQEIQRAERYAWPISILVIDLDHFKLINDEHGHAFGDAVLSQTSSLLRDTVGTIDHLARVGGEEFAVAAVAAEDGHGGELAQRILRRFRTHPWEQMKPGLKVTCSIGVAVLDPKRTSINPDTSLSQLLDEADRALYQVKESGRDNFKVAEPRQPGSPAPSFPSILDSTPQR